MHAHTNDVVISQSNSIANNESPLSQFDETIPGCVWSFWTHQQGLSRHHQKTKPRIHNNAKSAVSFFYKFLRTHYARWRTLVRGSHPCQRCSVLLEELMVSEIYLKPLSPRT